MPSAGLGREWLKDVGEVETSPLRLSKQEKVWTKYSNVPYCWLWKAIAEFYQTEETKACRRVQYWGGSPFDDYYYDKVIADCVELILMFGLSAVMGEVRHFSARSTRPTSLLFTGVDLERQREATKAFNSLKRLLNLASFTSHTPRTDVYRRAIPYNYWPSVLVLCKKVYDGVWWSGGFGGKSWAKVVEALQKLMYSWALGEYKRMVVQADQLVNLCHNNGLMLNKFNCMSYHVERILEAKKNGDSFYLSAIRFNRSPFCVQTNCAANLGLSKIWVNKEVR
jgi:hypothetical protein